MQVVTKMAITSLCLKIWLTRLWKCWVLWPPARGREITSSSRDLQRRGEERGRGLTCGPAQPPISTKASLGSFLGCGHTMAQPPQLLWGWYFNPPLLLRQPCSGSWKPGTALLAVSTPERKGAPPTSKWEHLEIASGSKFSWSSCDMEKEQRVASWNKYQWAFPGTKTCWCRSCAKWCLLRSRLACAATQAGPHP